MGEEKTGERRGGEIVEVLGGHIIRSTGRKDRHSKVFTAKGPRDRRVRLAAHTAIQFYDVQDRLGYDRPSKAVDWLIKNAKAAIDELALKQENISHNPTVFPSSSILPPSLESDAIADAIKSFFPGLSPGSELGEDLRLSLHSYQNNSVLPSSSSSSLQRPGLLLGQNSGLGNWAGHGQLSASPGVRAWSEAFGTPDGSSFSAGMYMAASSGQIQEEDENDGVSTMRSAMRRRILP